MKPITFEDANTNLTHPNLGIADMPACKWGDYFITRWRASFVERLSILLFGNVWVALIGQEHPPIAIYGGREANFEKPV